MDLNQIGMDWIGLDSADLTQPGWPGPADQAGWPAEASGTEIPFSPSVLSIAGVNK